MPGNTAPIFSRIAKVGWEVVAAANTTRDLTSGTIYLLFTADATNGSRAEKLILHPLGTNVATVVRLWLNNGSTTATLANNKLIDEITMAATTASEVAEVAKTELILNLSLPASYRIYATTGTSIAAGIAATVVGGDY